MIKYDVQEEILSKPQGTNHYPINPLAWRPFLTVTYSYSVCPGKSYALSVGEIYRVVKILRASTRLYKPWILLSPTSSNVLAVLDECVKLWLSSGLVEALLNGFNRQEIDHDDSADQLLESIKYIKNEVDSSTLHTCITSATSPTCYISGLNTDIVTGTLILAIAFRNII